MKKLLTLALAGICALAFAAVADAGTVNRIGTSKVGSVVNSYTGGNSQVYANQATGSGVAAGWNIQYIYSSNILNTQTVFDNLRNAIRNPYSGMVPAVANENGTVGLAISTYGTPNSNWTSAEWVARNVIPGRVAGISSGNSGSLDSGAVAAMHEEGQRNLAAEQAAEAENYAKWQAKEAERKAAWDAAEAAKAEEDPDYVPQEYVGSEYVPLDFGDTAVENQKALGSNQFESIVGTNIVTGYEFKDGKLVEVSNIENVMHVTTIYSQSCNKFVSPLVLDMTGNGVLQASEGNHMPGHPTVKTNLIAADFYGDGFEIGMEWVGPQDGLLVAPKADGSVDMSCLFGTAGGYESGYEKLSLFDTNKDGFVKGSELNGLSVWQDANTNGIAEAGEVKTVGELGITSITLTNSTDFISSFERNGQTYKMWDWWPNAVELVKISAK